MKIIKKKFHIFKRKLFCFFKGVYFPKSYHDLGIYSFIKQKNNIYYGIVDEVVIDNDRYLCLIKDLNPFNLIIRKFELFADDECLTHVDKNYLNDVYEKFANPNRKKSDAMIRVENFLIYGELKLQNEMPYYKYLYWNIMPYLGFVFGFYSSVSDNFQDSFSISLRSINFEQWSILLAFSLLSFAAILFNIQKRRYIYIWTNNITVFGFLCGVILYKELTIVIFILSIVLFIIFLVYIIRAFCTHASSSSIYMRLVSQRLEGAFYVSRFLLALFALSIIILFLIGF